MFCQSISCKTFISCSVNQSAVEHLYHVLSINRLQNIHIMFCQSISCRTFIPCSVNQSAVEHLYHVLSINQLQNIYIMFCQSLDSAVEHLYHVLSINQLQNIYIMFCQSILLDSSTYRTNMSVTDHKKTTRHINDKPYRRGVEWKDITPIFNLMHVNETTLTICHY